MRLLNIISKNLIVPKKRTFNFDELNGLLSGEFFTLNELDILEKLFNGEWQKYTNSFEKFYPKFAKKAKDMDLEVKYLVQLSDEELEKFNDVLVQNNYKFQYSNFWNLSIKCFFPYIIPIVSLEPQENKKDDIIGLGTHFSKFMKQNLSKKEILTVAAITTVNMARDKFFNLRNEVFVPNDRAKIEEYEYFLKSLFAKSEDFIQKIVSVISSIDDGDILNYGDQFDFFYENKQIRNWIDSIPVLNKYPDIKLNFSEFLYDYLFSDLQWAYKMKTTLEMADIRKNISNHGYMKPLEFSKISSIFNLHIIKSPQEQKAKELEIKRATEEAEAKAKRSIEQILDETQEMYIDDPKMTLVLDKYRKLKIENDEIVSTLRKKEGKKNKSNIFKSNKIDIDIMNFRKILQQNEIDDKLAFKKMQKETNEDVKKMKKLAKQKAKELEIEYTAEDITSL